MKRIMGLIRQDITLMLRDSIITYIALGPIIMALALRLFMPSVEDARLTFAVDGSVSAEYVSKLEQYGNVELFERKQDVIKRVESQDMVPGIVDEGGTLVMLLEGNENDALVQSMRSVFSEIAGEVSPIDFKAVSLESSNSFLREILTVLIIMTSIFLGGVAAGFTVVNEKDTKAIRALSVSPLKMSEFIAARGLVAFVISVAATLIGSIIISGSRINYLMLLVLLASSCTLVALVSLVVGRMASNQISAISSIKLAMPVFLTIPLASLFIPDKLMVLLYPFPNYWQFRALRIIYSGGAVSSDFWISIMMTFVLGTVLLAVLSKAMKKHFGIR